ncbi:MAG: hypothetical protein B7Z39_00340 [Novosphingobium sp. 12-64-8]|nr:MAG: hypothetical protein B7Z39_00340 [Novosphingobium sp. 12-64-8]
MAIDQPIFTGTAQLGDPFHVIVSENVVVGGATVIPKGTPGEGKVTFVAKNGSFGKSGILGIALRSLTIDGQKIVLDGRYREEAKNQDGATAMTFFMVGILAAPIRGKQSLIPAGRVLKARIGEEVALPPVSADVLETQLTNPAKSVQRPAVAWQPGNQPNTRPNIEEGVH